MLLKYFYTYYSLAMTTILQEKNIYQRFSVLFNNNYGNLFRFSKFYFLFKNRMNFNHFKWDFESLKKISCLTAKRTSLILIKLDRQTFPFLILQCKINLKQLLKTGTSLLMLLINSEAHRLMQRKLGIQVYADV